jgi:Tfp pilus assembly protein PilN
MRKHHTIKSQRKACSARSSVATAGAVGLGALLVFLGGLVMLGNKILDVFRSSKA